MLRVLPLATAALLFVGFVTAYSAQQLIEDELHQRLKYRTVVAASMIGNELKHVLDHARSLARNDLIINGLIDVDNRDSYLPVFFRSLFELGHSEAYIALTDYQGRSIVANRKKPEIMADTWITSVMNGNEYFSLSSQRLLLAVPVNYGGLPEGALVVSYSGSEFAQVLGLTSETLTTLMVGPQNQVMFSSNPQLARSGDQAPTPEIAGWVLAQAIIPGHPELAIISAQTVAALYGPIIRLWQFLLAALSLNILALAIGVGLTARLTSKQIQRFIQRLEVFKGAEDMGKRLTLEGPAELQVLGLSFNTLLERLQKTSTSKKFLDNILSSMSEVLVVTDSLGNVQMVNPAAQRFVGNASDVVGKSLLVNLTFTRGQDEIAFTEFVKGLHEQHKLECPQLSTDGKLSSMLWSKSRITSSANHTPDFIYVAQDISARRETEQSLQLAYESIQHSPEAVFWIKPDAGLFHVNHRACEALGYTRDELLAMTVPDIDPDFPAETWLQAWQQVRTGTLTQFESRHRRKDGAVFPVEVNVNYLAYNNQDYLFAYVRNITDRKLAEEALRESERRLTTLMASMPGMAYRCRNDRYWTMEFVSERCLELTGYRPETITTDEVRFGDIIHQADREFVWIAVQKAVAEKHPYQFVYRINTAAGECKWVLEKGEGIFSEDSKLLALEGFITDITEQKLAEQELQRYRQKLERLVEDRTADLIRTNKELQNFTYMVSHDLRSPLVSIQGFIGELRADLSELHTMENSILSSLEGDQETKTKQILHENIPEAIEFIDMSATKMDRLIGAILQLSRMERREFQYEHVDVRELVEQNLKILSYELEQVDIQVIIGNLPTVTTDALALEQIFSNLLSNAVKYMTPRRAGEISISAEQGDGEFIFRIDDNGRGIAEQDIPKIFQIFQRVDIQDVPGEGMGLAYVRTLVERLGGRIWCESEIGKGSSFSFTLPTQPNTNLNSNKDMIP